MREMGHSTFPPASEREKLECPLLSAQFHWALVIAVLMIHGCGVPSYVRRFDSLRNRLATVKRLHVKCYGYQPLIADGTSKQVDLPGSAEQILMATRPEKGPQPAPPGNPAAGQVIECLLVSPNSSDESFQLLVGRGLRFWDGGSAYVVRFGDASLETMIKEGIAKADSTGSGKGGRLDY
jgi:hypothetical protein